MREMRSRNLPLTCLIGSIALVLVACSTAAGPSASPAPRASDGPAPSISTTPSTQAPQATVNAWLLVGRAGEPGLQLIEAQTGEVAIDLPPGAPDPDWHRLVTARVDGSRTTVSDEIVQPGLGGPKVQLEGAWRLPTIGSERVSAGVSLDGSTIALVPTNETPGVSRFAIASHVLADRLSTAREAELRLERVIELPGSFDYDALSPDGRILYVAQHLDTLPGAYQVRAVDVSTGRLRDGVIVDKRNIDETMAGWPIAQLRRPDGVVLTLYRGTEHPFIHALNTIDAWAVCIDLPASKASDAAAGDWGLAPSDNGAAVYAINASLGLAAEINSTELTVRRTSTLQTAAGGSSAVIVLAKFGHGPVGSAGRVVASPDGETVWAAGADGILAVGTRDLTVSRRMLEGTAVDGIAVAPDGSLVFALIHDGGRIVALDPGTGRELGTVPGDGFDRLLSTAPW